MPASAQWTKFPLGASGSRMISTSSRVARGIPEKRSGNEMSAPSQV
jgi:hypothetical protein